MYNLIVDDLRDCQMCFNVTDNNIYLDKDWIIVKTYDDFCDIISQRGLPEFISLDHDLADFVEVDGEQVERTGKTCANWLVDYCMDNDVKLPEYHAHSSNPRGVDNIMSYLDNYKRISS